MAEEAKTKLRLELGHVLFMDIVGYSKLLVDEQRARRGVLNEVVRQSDEFQAADAAGTLIKSPSGDGMALVFHGSPEEPVECAVEISRALKNHPEMQLRMGVHSGPASAVVDVNGQTGVAGAGMNMAQRVMDCGDAGHILLSKRVAEDLEQHAHWKPHLHDLGECEVKHGLRVHLVNLYTDEVGNPALPEKVQCALGEVAAVQLREKKLRRRVIAAVALGLIAIVAGFVLWKPRASSSQPGAQSAAAPAAELAEKSIAVLPFDNRSREPDNAFFADGVQDEILTHLAQIADLRVISRTSVMQYKSDVPRNMREIGLQLGVAHLLEGSVQKEGKTVRVDTKLIDARTDSLLWADKYDRPYTDVFAIQSEIATAIAEQLRAKLSPVEKAAIKARPTTDLTALEQYNRAKTLLLTSPFSSAMGKSFTQAIELLNSAVGRDPSFHAAYVQLVFANARLYSSGDHTPQRLAAAEAALQSAAQLQPDAAETHLARGLHLYYARRDFHGALAELDVAGRTLTNDPRIPFTKGLILRRQGKHEEGLRALEQAIALDPRNVFFLNDLALSYQGLRRYADEAAVLDRAAAIAPENLVVAGTRALVDFLGRGQTEPLHQFIDRLREEQPGALNEVGDIWLLAALAERDWAGATQALSALGTKPFVTEVSLSHHFAEGLLARAMKDEDRARRAFTAARAEQEQIVQQQKDYGPAYCVLGLIDAALGNRDAALEAGRHAVELLPVAKDPLSGQRLLAYYAMIAAWAGDKELALQQLAIAAPTPGASFIASYGVLKLLPFWDPLRDDARFDQIVASLAPKP